MCVLLGAVADLLGLPACDTRLGILGDLLLEEVGLKTTIQGRNERSDQLGGLEKDKREDKTCYVPCLEG